MSERLWGGVALVVGCGLLAWMSLNFFKAPAPKQQPTKSDVLNVCWIGREDFYASDHMLELAVADIKKFGGWKDVNLEIKKVPFPKEVDGQPLYFFADKAATDKWVWEQVNKNCGSSPGSLKVVMAGFITDFDAWGYAKVNEGVVAVLEGIQNSFLADKQVQDIIKEAAVMHEIGHVWGLDHNQVPNCLMNPKFENVSLGDRDFDNKIQNFIKDNQGKMSGAEMEEKLREDLGLTFCQYEADLLKTLKSPYLKW